METTTDRPSASTADTAIESGTAQDKGQIINPSKEDQNPNEHIKMKTCPIENTFKIIGKKFTVLILRNMINGKQNRFNQLLNSIEQGNPKTLTIRLREMEKSGLIKRKVYYQDSPVRIEYYPTEKGIALQPILDMMAAYSMHYCSKDIFKDAKPRNFKEVYGRDIANISQLN